MARSEGQNGPSPVECGFGPTLKDDARDEPIAIRGARVHNLKGLDCDIPRNRLVVITGPSGSGKSSLAFDTLYAEGQRRYVESLSPWARQFLEQMDRPEVESVTGLSPAIAIEQRTTVAHPRSTVGTVTEIYDHLRVLFATLGRPHCPRCGEAVAAQRADEMAARLIDQAAGAVAVIAAPVARGRKGGYRKELVAARAAGLQRARIDGHAASLGDKLELDPRRGHRIDVLVDRLVLRPDAAERLRQSLEKALQLARGVVLVSVEGRGERLLSQHLACARCDVQIPELVAARLLLQQRSRRLPGLRRARAALDRGRRARDPRRVEEHPGRRDPALAPPRAAPAARSALRGRRAQRLLARGAGRRAAEGGARGAAPRRRAGLPGGRALPAQARDEPAGPRPGPERRGCGRRRRGVRGPAPVPLGGALPRVQGDAAAAREPGRALGGPLGGRPDAAAARARARGGGGARVPRARAAGRRTAGLRDHGARRRARVAGPRLPHARPRDHDAVGWRGAPRSARHADRRAHAGARLRARRALGRPAPERQRAPDPDARIDPRLGQHGGGGGARRGDDPCRRLGARPGRGSGTRAAGA